MFNFFSGSADNIDCETFSELSKQDYVILDVRTREEYNQARICNCKNLDFYSPDFRNEILKLDKNKNYLVYCRSGNRSGQTVSYMLKNGFSNAKNLAGGIVRWHSEGREIIV